MSYKFFLIIFLTIIFINNNQYSQIIVDSRVRINNIDFSLAGEEMIITYDLVNTKPVEKYQISVSIYTIAGKKLDAKSLTGDVGGDISGGYNKKIIWLISEDIAYLDDQIYIEIEAVHQNPRIIKPTGKGKAMILSTVFPGWGSSKTTLKGGHVMKGFLGYGCIVGFIYYNNLSDQSYTDYLNSSAASDREDLYDLSQKQHKNSQYMLIASGAVWLWDYATVFAAPNRSKKKGFKSEVVYLGPGINSQSNTLTMSVVLNF